MTERSSFVYVHTYFHQGCWRLYEGLILIPPRDALPNSGALKHDDAKHGATLLVVDEFGAFHVRRELHRSIRISASWWVYVDEAQQAIDDIEKDWSERECWREAHQDAQKLAARLARK